MPPGALLMLMPMPIIISPSGPGSGSLAKYCNAHSFSMIFFQVRVGIVA